MPLPLSYFILHEFILSCLLSLNISFVTCDLAPQQDHKPWLVCMLLIGHKFVQAWQDICLDSYFHKYHWIGDCPNRVS